MLKKCTLLVGWMIAALSLTAFADDPQPVTDRQALAAQPGEGRIARSTFTTQVIDREPADSITTLTTADDRLYYFTELLEMEGQTVIHRWSYEGEVMAEVSFSVGGPRWRVWSSKSLVSAWTGEWEVSVLDQHGEILGGNRFSYLPAAR